MITCPVCGFEQSLGPTCSQCQTPLSSASSSGSGGSGGEQSSADPSKASLGSSSGRSSAGSTPAKTSSLPTSGRRERKPDPPSADTEPASDRPIHQAREKPIPVRLERPGPTKKQSVSGESEAQSTSPKMPASSKEKKPEALEPASNVPVQKVKESPPSPGSVTPWPTKKQSASSEVREKLEHLEQLIVTTTPGIEGRLILAYKGVVSATVLVRGDVLIPQFHQGIKGEVASIRSSSLEEPFERARAIGLSDLKVEAAKRGANAVVGLTITQAPATEGIWLHMVGTAVTLKE